MSVEYHANDRRVGDICIINGKDTYEHFCADLASAEPISGSLSQESLVSVGNHDFTLLHQDFVHGELELVFYVGGTTKNVCDINCSRLIMECKTCVVKWEGQEFEYASVLQSFEVEESGIEFYNIVTLKFTAIKRQPLVTLEVNADLFMFNNIGTVASGLRIKVVPTTSLSRFVIGEIVIVNLSQGKEYIIDGILGKVTENGVNCFGRTNLIDFPKVQPGNNMLNTTISQAEVQIEYYPVFVM